MPYRQFITGSVVVGMMFWCPRDFLSGYPRWTGLAIAALAGIAVWCLFTFWWRKWNPTAVQQERFGVTLTGVAAGVLLMGAINATQLDYHYECSQYAGNGENRECVGDTVRVEGPALGQAMLLVFGAWIVFTVGLKQKTPE